MFRTTGFLVAGFAIFACSSAPQPQVGEAPRPSENAAPAPSASGTPLETPLLKLAQPTAHQVVTSPLQVRGEARGTWYFEATFPLELLDDGDHVIARGYAQAEGEWMTEDFVPFKSELSFSGVPGKAGTLVLHKANASGLPEHDQTIRVPVSFAGSQP